MTSPPVKYVRQADYTGFEAAHPTDTKSGASLDADFGAVLVSNNAIIDRLAQVQRSDGALANLCVTPDSFSAASLALMAGTGVPRGAWLTATAYIAKDLVSQSGLTYIAVTAHTSGVFATDLAAGKWLLFSAGLTPFVLDTGNNTVGLNVAAGGTNATPFRLASTLNAAATIETLYSGTSIKLGIGAVPTVPLYIASNPATTPASVVEINPITGTNAALMSFAGTGAGRMYIGRCDSGGNSALISVGTTAYQGVIGLTANLPLSFVIGGAETARFTSLALLVGKTVTGLGTPGFSAQYTGQTDIVVAGSECMNICRLSNNGNMIRFFHTDNSTVIGSIVTSGGTTTSYNTSSDIEFKDDVKPAGNVGHLFDDTPVSEFTWKDDGAKQIAGFVAQDLLVSLAPLVPGLVNQRDDGMWEYDPSKLVPLCFREIQSLRARLAAAAIP